MPFKTISWRIFIAGALLIYAVKFVVRPYVPVPDIAQPLVDVFPNLAGTFLLPFGTLLFLGKYIRMQTAADLRLICGSGLLLVIINEYLQRISFFGRTFDYLDIAASFAGITAGYFVIALFISRSAASKA